MNSIPDFFKKTVDENPNKTAIIIENKEYSYKDIDRMSSSISYNLSKFHRNSVISMMLDNSIEFIITYLGILKSSNIAHIIPSNISKINLNDQLHSAQPKCIISSKHNISVLEEEKVYLELLDVKEISSKKDASNEKIKIKNKDYAYLIYTSGTTGKPKGIAITHANVLFTTKNIIDVLQYKKSDREILPLSLSHSFGLGCLHTGFHIGSTIILHKNSTNIQDILSNCKKFKANTLAAVPATLSKMVENHYEETENSCRDLRLIITNSTAIPENTVRKIIDILDKGVISTYYGLTEASRSSFMKFNEKIGRYNSVGRAAPNVEIKISDMDETTGIGEICVKGENVIERYWKNEKMNEKIQHGWLKTSDLGHFDKDGYLYLDGRLDDMINVGGEKVFPSEIEMVVNELDGIEEAVVVGASDEKFGQVVKLFAKKTTKSEIDESMIMSYCIKKLERYKVPIKIQFIHEFPRTEYGKIKRSELKSW